jgi:hypothetical protein
MAMHMRHFAVQRNPEKSNPFSRRDDARRSPPRDREGVGHSARRKAARKTGRGDSAA